MTEPQVVLVDLQDKEIGVMGKQAAHEQARLHRAFSVFLYKGSQLLIQQRALGKYHCPGIWANTCCSHPMPGESVLQGAIRRLKEETGIAAAELQELFSFSYFAAFENGLAEFEYDHVLIGECQEESFSFDQEEIARLQWVERDWLLQDMAAYPRKYAPWFHIAAPKVIEAIRK